MASGRGSVDSESHWKAGMSGERIGSSRSGYRDGHTNGYKNGVNGKTNGKSEQKSNWQNDFFESFEETPLLIAILTYLGYAMLVIVGHIRDFLRFYGIEKDKSCTEPNLEGYVPLYQSWESFYTRNVYRRIRDVWNIPIASCAGSQIDILERVTHDHGWSFEYVPLEGLLIP